MEALTLSVAAARGSRGGGWDDGDPVDVDSLLGKAWEEPARLSRRGAAAAAVAVGGSLTLAALVLGASAAASGGRSRRASRWPDAAAALSLWRDPEGRCLTYAGIDQSIPLKTCTGAKEQEFSMDTKEGGLLRWAAHPGHCISAGISPGKRFPLTTAVCSADDPGQLWGGEGEDLTLRRREGSCIFFSRHEEDPAWGGPCAADGRPVPVADLHEQQHKKNTLQQSAPWATEEKESAAFRGVSGRPAALAGREVAGVTLFCFMAVLPESTEVELAHVARERNASIFACEQSRVYDSYPSPFVHQGDWNSFANVRSFIKVWRRVFDDGLWKGYDWTVKVDPDTVWAPERLKLHLLAIRPQGNQSLYVKNSDIAFGFLGPIEVISEAAVRELTRTYLDCQVGPEETGEDGWLKYCLDRSGAHYLRDTTILNCNGAVEVCSDWTYAAFHPHKKVWDWGQCLDRMQ